MPSYNRVILMGNLTRDPELKILDNDNAVCNFGMAMNEYYTNKDGEKVETACFVEVEAWGRQAEVVHEYCTKGSPLFIEGSLKLDQWENEDGEKRSRLRVRLFRLQLIGSKDDNASGSESSGNSKSSQAQSEETQTSDDNDSDDPIPF